MSFLLNIFCSAISVKKNILKHVFLNLVLFLIYFDTSCEIYIICFWGTYSMKHKSLVNKTCHFAKHMDALMHIMLD